MRMSQLLSQTRREDPANSEAVSNILLIRAGFIEQLGSGIFALLPLGLKAANRIKKILHEEMQAIQAQEMLLPVVQPAEIWQKTGRWQSVGAEMGRLLDRQQQPLVLAMTHEEACTCVVARFIQSYRQLPLLVYHIQTKWRDDPRPRAGLIRVREFEMKDSYSFDADYQGLVKQYQAHYQAYHKIFNRCRLPVITVEADSGIMGEGKSHEFIYLTPVGEDSILSCASCNYAANRQVARKQSPPPDKQEPLALQPFATPDCSTVAQLTAKHQINGDKIAKILFLHCQQNQPQDEATTFTLAAIIRGDMELNETAIAAAMQVKILRPASAAEIIALGSSPGYAGPVGLDRTRCKVVVDTIISQSNNLVCGANKEGWHQYNLNYGRDYQADLIADLAAVRSGDPCPECGQPLSENRGVEVGNIFQLGKKYSTALGCYFQSEDGSMQAVHMGSYGIGVGRLLASIAEEHHDDNGLIWPLEIAPYQVHLVLLDQKREPAAAELADKVYQQLQQQGLEVLFDERSNVQAGVKFKDADLLGMPIRLTVSRRSMTLGGIELRRRDGQQQLIVSEEQLLTELQLQLKQLAGGEE